MALPATDNFNRSDENLDVSANWTQIHDGDARVVSNQCNGASTNSDCVTKWVSDTFDDDQYSQAEFVSSAKTYAYAGIGARLTGAATASCDGYVFGATSTQVRLYRYDNGTKTSLADTSRVVTSGNVLKIETSGTDIDCYDEATGVLSITDSTYSSGVAGVWHTNNNDTLIDNWEGGNLGAAAADPLAPIMQSIRRQRAAYLRM